MGLKRRRHENLSTPCEKQFVELWDAGRRKGWYDLLDISRLLRRQQGKTGTFLSRERSAERSGAFRQTAQRLSTASTQVECWLADLRHG